MIVHIYHGGPYYGGLMVRDISADMPLWCSTVTVGAMEGATAVIVCSILPIMGPLIIPYRAMQTTHCTEYSVHNNMWRSCCSLYRICNRTQ